jgi:hypothetical protein
MPMEVGNMDIRSKLVEPEVSDVLCSSVFQREDLAGFGRLILALSCGTVVNPSLEFMAGHYSADLVQVTQALLTASIDNLEGGGISSIRQLDHVLAQRMFSEVRSLSFPLS